MPTVTSKQPLCCVTIGYDHFILSATDGMKVAQLLAKARTARQDYVPSQGYVYQLQAQPTVAWTSVEAKQLIAAHVEGDPAAGGVPSRRRAKALTLLPPALPAPGEVR